MGSYFPLLRESKYISFPFISNFLLTSISNMYVFPGIGLGSILCKAAHISQEMVCLQPPPPPKPLFNKTKIYTSAVALSTAINQKELNEGRLYPDITRIREVSVIVAREVIRQAQREKLDREKSIRDLSDKELDEWIKARMYDPAAQNRVVESQGKEKFPGGKSLL